MSADKAEQSIANLRQALDRLDDVQLYVSLALAALALGSLLYLLFFVLIAMIIF